MSESVQLRCSNHSCEKPLFSKVKHCPFCGVKNIENIPPLIEEEYKLTPENSGQNDIKIEKDTLSEKKNPEGAEKDVVEKKSEPSVFIWKSRPRQDSQKKNKIEDEIAANNLKIEQDARDKAKSESEERAKAEAERAIKLKVEQEAAARDKAKSDLDERAKAEAERASKLKVEEEAAAREKAKSESDKKAKKEAEQAKTKLDGETTTLYKRAVEFILNSRKTSISHLQSHLGISYDLSLVLINKMEKEGLVSAIDYNGLRKILVDTHWTEAVTSNIPENKKTEKNIIEKKEEQAGPINQSKNSWKIYLIISVMCFVAVVFYLSNSKKNSNVASLKAAAPPAPQASKNNSPNNNDLPTPSEIENEVRQGNFVKAEKLLLQVIKAKPASTKAHYELAQIFISQKRYSDARAELLVAKELDPNLSFEGAPGKFNELYELVDSKINVKNTKKIEYITEEKEPDLNSLVEEALKKSDSKSGENFNRLSR